MKLARTPHISRWHWVLLLLGLALLYWLSGTQLTGSAVIKDASENLQMALNVAHHGVMSLDPAPPYRPSMMREPVPIGALACAVYLSDRAFGELADPAYFSGERARLLKHLNLVWLTLLCGAAFLAMLRFGAPFPIAELGSVLIWLHFTVFVPLPLRQTLGIDNLDTELAAAALLLTSSLLLSAVYGRHLLMFACGALLMGLTALSKAAVFYVGIGVLLALIVLQMFPVLRAANRVTVPITIAVLAFFATPLAWMTRNVVQTGSFQIAERSGSVLMHRALMDTMTAAEYVGAFTTWSDPHIRWLLARITGFGPQDEQPGGRLQHVAESFSGAAQEREIAAEDRGRPDEALTWYHKARALYELHLATFTAAGVRYPSGAADRATRHEALMLILRHPLMHAAVTPLLIWRAAPMMFVILVVATLCSGRHRRADLALFVLPGLGLTVFYALASQFAPRFSETIFPIAIVALWALIAGACSQGMTSASGARGLFNRNGPEDVEAPDAVVPDEDHASRRDLGGHQI